MELPDLLRQHAEVSDDLADIVASALVRWVSDRIALAVAVVGKQRRVVMTVAIIFVATVIMAMVMVQGLLGAALGPSPLQIFYGGLPAGVGKEETVEEDDEVCRR